MIKDLVSIIVPCYNGQKYIKELFLSVANQTYNSIELILINDVSTDNTDDYVKKYRHILDNKNISLKYEVLSKKGYAAGAVNRGLKLMEGEYFMLLDCDDYIYPDNVLKKVEFLNNNKNYAWVMTMARVVDGVDHSKVERIYTRIKSLRKMQFFKDLIWGKNVFYTPGIYMYRTKDYLKINPKKEIYISRGGQNYQMLLPMAFNYKIGYIRKILFDWYVYPNSHSHDIDSYEKHVTIINEHNNIIYNTVKNIKIKNKSNILNIVEEKHNFTRLFKTLEYSNYDKYDDIYNELKLNGKLTFKIRILNLKVTNLFVKNIFLLQENLKKLVINIIKRKNND